MHSRLLLFLVGILLLTSCASKRYAKKGAEFESAGYYEKAADMYYISVVKNSNNVNAQIGLKKTGQLTLDKKLGEFLSFYQTDQTKEAVYKYLEAKKFSDKLNLAGTNLNFPDHYTEYYNEVKSI